MILDFLILSVFVVLAFNDVEGEYETNEK